MQELLIDLETELDEKLFDKVVKAGFVELPEVKTFDEVKEIMYNELSVKYKKEETIQKYLEPQHVYARMNKENNALEKIKREYSLNPLFAKIKLVTVWTPRNGIEQASTDFFSEKELIEWLADKLTGAMPLVTFNGASFDFPVLLSRAEITKATINYTFLQQLVEGTASKGQHVDLFRTYKYTQGKSNLSLQLFVRGFGQKKEIDFFKCSLEELQVYAKDEMQRLVNWWLLRTGRD